MVNGKWRRPSTIHHSPFTIKQVSRPRRVALEAGADEAGGEGRLELFADAPEFFARGRRVFADERAPVRGDGDGGFGLALRLRGFAARERLDPERVEFPLGDEAVAV